MDYFEKNVDKFLPKEKDMIEKDYDYSKIRHEKKQTKPMASIDLHLMRAHQAKIEVKNFVQNCYMNSISPICIIAGKGFHSQNFSSSLKEIIKEYLKSDLNQFVAEITDLKASKGSKYKKNTGALFVRLKKRKKC